MRKVLTLFVEENFIDQKENGTLSLLFTASGRKTPHTRARGARGRSQHLSVGVVADLREVSVPFVTSQMADGLEWVF